MEWGEGGTDLFPDQDLILVLVTLGDLVLHSTGLTCPHFLAHFLEVWTQ